MTAAEEDLRCSPWTRAQGVDPIGSAGAFDALLLVEWPLPWPADVADIPALAPIAATPGLRLMLVVPRADERPAGEVLVVHRRRTGTNHLAGVDHVAPRAELADLLARLAAAAHDDTSGWPSATGASPAEVLVCGHGRRDPCCGRWGTLLHVEMAARGSRARVWRCSHTGGHRFAPTAITLPEGRAWAYADADLLDGLVTRTADVHQLAAHDRGTTSLDPWAQVVERALFERTGWGWLDVALTGASTAVAPDGRSATVELTWPGGLATGEVEVARVLPVLACGQPPEAATKTSPEYRLRALHVA